MLCHILEFELYQKTENLAPENKKAHAKMLETKEMLIKKFTETNDDILVNLALEKLSEQEISLKRLVDNFQAYKMSAEFDILVPKDVSIFNFSCCLGLLELHMGFKHAVFQASIHRKHF